MTRATSGARVSRRSAACVLARCVRASPSGGKKRISNRKYYATFQLYHQRARSQRGPGPLGPASAPAPGAPRRGRAWARVGLGETFRASVGPSSRSSSSRSHVGCVGLVDSRTGLGEGGGESSTGMSSGMSGSVADSESDSGSDGSMSTANICAWRMLGA